jgi:IS30 family transposase
MEVQISVLRSRKKGTVENTNGLIRRFLSKSTKFDNIIWDEIAKIEF